MFFSIMSAGMLEDPAGSSYKGFCKRAVQRSITVVQIHRKSKMCPMKAKAFHKILLPSIKLFLRFFLYDEISGNCTLQAQA